MFSQEDLQAALGRTLNIQILFFIYLFFTTAIFNCYKVTDL